MYVILSQKKGHILDVLGYVEDEKYLNNVVYRHEDILSDIGYEIVCKELEDVRKSKDKRICYKTTFTFEKDSSSGFNVSCDFNNTEVVFDKPCSSRIKLKYEKGFEDFTACEVSATFSFNSVESEKHLKEMLFKVASKRFSDYYLYKCNINLYAEYLVNFIKDENSIEKESIKNLYYLSVNNETEISEYSNKQGINHYVVDVYVDTYSDSGAFRKAFGELHNKLAKEDGLKFGALSLFH